MPVGLVFRRDTVGDQPREVVEFAAAFYNVRTNAVDFTFQRYVRPTCSGPLSPDELARCRLKQEQIDAAQDLPTVLQEFDARIQASVSLKFEI